VEGPFSIGLNEVAIGMTMHHAGIELAQDRLSKAAFQRSVINAEMFDPQGAVVAGFLDKVVAPEELHAAALEALETKGGAVYGCALYSAISPVEVGDRRCLSTCFNIY
jgi:enoyl-CoA hydratase/carnithine racemase